MISAFYQIWQNLSDGIFDLGPITHDMHVKLEGKVVISINMNAKKMKKKKKKKQNSILSSSTSPSQKALITHAFYKNF